MVDFAKDIGLEHRACLCLVKRVQGPLELGGEEDGAEGHREDVCDGFCEEDCEDLVGKKGWHDVDEGYEEDYLSHACDHD